MNIVIPITSLTGGVSTQPESLRLPIQADRSDNVIATVVDGLRVRPPTEYLGSFEGFPTALSSTFTILTNDGDYVVAATNGALKVFSADDIGAEVIVRNAAGGVASGSDFDYLDTSSPDTDIQFLQLADYTLVLNRAKTTAASTSLTEVTASQALVSIISGAYSKRYQINVSHDDGDHCDVRVYTWNSLGHAFGSTGGGASGNVPVAEQSVTTDYIARELAGFLSTGISATGIASYGSILSGSATGLSASKWEVTQVGGVIRICRLDGTDFHISIEESQGSTSMALAYQKVQLFTDLPAKAPVGMKIEVAGDPDKNASSYWVKFVANDDGAEEGDIVDGYWEECPAPGISEGLDASTMPHALIRQANGQFRFTPLTGYSYSISGTSYDVPKWEVRQVGDDDTNPHPDFLGKPLVGFCFHAGRLGLLCESSFILSETRSPFSLYRTSAIDVVDSDRIEVKLPSIRAEKFRHAVSLGADIILVSDETQFVLRAEGPFTPNSVSLVAGGRYGSHPTVPPIAVGTSLFIPTAQGIYGKIQEAKVLGDARPSLQALAITASADKYLEVPRYLLHSPQLDMVLAVGRAEMWPYTYFFQGQEKVQQAWQRWTFPSTPVIYHAWFKDTDLYIVQGYTSSQVDLVKMRLQAGAVDGEGDPVTHFDRRVNESFATVSYADGFTTFTLPFEPSVATEAININGKALRVDEVTGNDVVVVGDLRDTGVWIGVPYEWRHDLSKVYTIGNRQDSVIEGILRLESAKVAYSDSGPFDVHILGDDGSESVSWFSGPYLGMGANYQKLRLTSGEFTFPIRARARETRISFRGRGPLAARLVSLDINARVNAVWGKRQ